MDKNQNTGAMTPTPAFPPPGWVTNHEAARRLGVGLDTLTCAAWRWRTSLREVAKRVRHPRGWQCNIYPLEVIDRIRGERAAAAQPTIPQGYVDKGGACRFFGVSLTVWKHWIRQGKVRCGRIISSPSGQKRLSIYALADLERLREELFGEDKLYKRCTDNVYHVPAGLLRREEACERFGVSTTVWVRWEREGHITGGRRVPGGPMLYRLEEIERMLDEYGKYCPAYPDQSRPGVFRVPLGGRGIKRREALIDGETLALIAGGNCHFAQTGKGTYDAGGGSYVGISWPNGTSTPLRRLIMGVTDSQRQVGHVNGDPLDCRRANLFVRTIQQRTRGACKMKSIRGRPCTSRFKGVFFEAWTKKWRSKIEVNGKIYSLGRYGDEIAAAQAYDEAARRYFGTYAWLNFPDGLDAWLEAEATRTERTEAA